MVSVVGNEIDFDSFFNVIDGKLTKTVAMRCGIDPATEIANAPVPVSTKEDVELAMTSAKKAFEKWSITSVAERRETICALADAMEANLTGFANMLTTEQGRPVDT